MFESCILPSVWLKSVINPISKGSNKDPYIPLNYRGISLLSCVGKVFTGIINHSIVDYCEFNNIYEDEQNGFRHKRSCEDHIYTLTSIITNRLSHNQSTYCCFIDMQKAFDWVDKDLLFYKLLKYDINGNIYKCIKATYGHPIVYVIVKNNVTDWFNIGSGVRQGDSLSPTLIGLYINDLITDVKALNLGINVNDIIISILAFADDTVILAKNEKDLQDILNCVENWCNKW